MHFFSNVCQLAAGESLYTVTIVVRPKSYHHMHLQNLATLQSSFCNNRYLFDQNKLYLISYKLSLVLIY